MKYIDAERLKAEIERHIKEVKEAENRFHPNLGFFDAKLSGIYDILSIIDSLQQEQPERSEKNEKARKFLSFIDSLSEEPVEKTCKTCGFYENNCPFIRGKFIPYPNKVCKDYTFSKLKAEQEPVSDELEEAADKYEQEYFTDATLGEAFIAGADWQKGQDMGEWLKDRDGCFWDGVNEGKKAMKEQMLKDAVEGFIFQSADYYPKQLIAGYEGDLGMGDKVRIIIVKEEKK